MLNISLILEPDEEARLRAMAKSLGMSVSAYARQVLRDSLRRDPEAGQAKLLRGIRAFIPVLAEAFGRRWNESPEQVAKLTQALLARYDREV